MKKRALEKLTWIVEVNTYGKLSYALLSDCNKKVRGIREDLILCLYEGTGIPVPDDLDVNISDADVHFESGSISMQIPLELDGVLATAIEELAEQQNLFIEEMITKILSEVLMDESLEEDFNKAIPFPEWADEEFFETYD